MQKDGTKENSAPQLSAPFFAKKKKEKQIEMSECLGRRENSNNNNKRKKETVELHAR